MDRPFGQLWYVTVVDRYFGPFKNTVVDRHFGLLKITVGDSRGTVREDLGW